MDAIVNKHVKWTEVSLFFVVAVLVSAPFRLGMINMDQLLPLPGGFDVFYRVLRGIGPATAAFLMFYVVKSKVGRTVTIKGKNLLLGLISILPIPVGLAIAGVRGANGLADHYSGLLFGIMLVFYALCEEYGWRGYLQQALSPVKLPYRILLITVFWYAWHLNFLNPAISLKSHIIHFLSLLFGSWGLLKISEVSGSLLFVSAVHLSFNLLMDTDCTSSSKLIILGVSVLVWVGLVLLFIRLDQTILNKG